MSKKYYAVIASILFYVSAFLLLWNLMMQTSLGSKLIYFGFPFIVACYFMVAGPLFHRYLQIKYWHLWLCMNLIGYPLCWIIVTLWKPMMWFNLGMLPIIILVTIALAGAWGMVGICFLCMRLFKQHATISEEVEPYMQKEKIHRISFMYLLFSISGPSLMIGLFFLCFSTQLALSVITVLVGIMLWIFLFPRYCQKFGRNLLKKKAEGSNLVYDDVFECTDWFLVVDNEHKKLGLLLMWNPFHPYILSAGRVTYLSVDDGNMGNGVLGGTCRVSLLISIDGKKIRLTTFSTNFNNRLGLDNELVREGIAEAEKMKQAIQRIREGTDKII